MTAAVPVAALLCTRNRGDAVVRAVRSVLRDANPAPVLVVDQSDGDATARALEGIPDPRLTLLRSSSRGLAAARNHGLRVLSEELVACTDDDCEVEPGWRDGLGEALSARPEVGVVLGRVSAAPHDPTTGFVPAFEPRERLTARRARDAGSVDGMGACMALRRSAWDRLGGFDEALGAGARFPAAEEGDLVLRALEAGFTVIVDPGPGVLHHGCREREALLELLRSYYLGTGAMLAKHVRLGHPGALVVLLTYLGRWTMGRPAVSYGTLPPRLPRLRSFLSGMAAGWATPLDRPRGRFAGERVERGAPC